MFEHIVHTNSADESITLGERLGRLLQPHTVITLEGDLGAGKTTFTKGIARGLGVKRTVSSPTFTIIKEYQGIMPLYHIDAYRLEFSDEDLGFDEYIDGEGVTVIEWSQFIEDYIPNERIDIIIHYLNEDERQFKLIAHGTKYEELIKQL